MTDCPKGQFLREKYKIINRAYQKKGDYERIKLYNWKRILEVISPTTCLKWFLILEKKSRKKYMVMKDKVSERITQTDK